MFLENITLFFYSKRLIPDTFVKNCFWKSLDNTFFKYSKFPVFILENNLWKKKQI